jgi:hypothetical protein
MSSGDVTPGVAKYIQSFDFGKMRVARKDDAPLKQKRKAAFALAAPTKQPAKLQFSTANVGKKPGSKEQQKEDAAAAKKDSKLQLWLQAGHGDRPGMEEAREYLMRGIPYKGTHARNTKDAVKDQGAVWMKNPLKLNDERDGISPGWFVAHSERALIDLIRMPRIKSNVPDWMKKYKKVDETEPQWSPIDVPEASHEMVVLLILEYEADVKEKFELEQKVANRARDAKEQAKLNSQRTDGIPADSEEHIARIKRDWGIVWTEDMAMAASRCPGLGPHMGTSSVFRAIRGLHLKVCTPQEVKAGVYTMDAGRRTKAQLMQQHAGSSTDDAPVEFIDYTKVPIVNATSGCYMFGKGDGMIPLPTDSEWTALKEALQEADLRSHVALSANDDAPSAPRQTFCTSCLCEIMEQFNDCSCNKNETSREWEWCDDCNCAYSSGQVCACEAPAEWARQQQKCREENELRVEKANRDAALEEHIEHRSTATVDAGPEAEAEEVVDEGETLEDFWGT